MGISTDNPKECHNMMYAALENYRAGHKGPWVPENGGNTYRIQKCEHCKGFLNIEHSSDGNIKSFSFSKRYCEKGKN